MTQTQLASMFLGSPHTLDRDDKLRGVSSQLDATIHILDGQSYNGKILGYITAKHIIEDAHKKSLEDTLETYDFVTFSDKDFSEHLEKRNRIIIPDEDDTLREFIIFEVGREKDGSSYETTVFTHASYLELRKAGVLYSDIFKGTASQHIGRTLNNTGWQPGIIEAGGNITIEREDYTNPYEFLRVIAKEFDAELRFRVEHDGNKVTGRYVDLLERIGEWRGREAEFGKDLDSIKRIEEQDIVTALLGLGPEDSDGRRSEVLVEDDDALKRWGREDEYGNLQHLVEVYEIQSDRNEMTVSDARRYTRSALDKRINEQVTYEAKIVDLENVPGMENKKIRFGDTLRIKDEKFNPPLYLKTIVFEHARCITSNAKKEVKLGDYTEFTEEDVNAIWTMLRREIRKKTDIDTLHEYAEPKKIESDTPPEIKDGENPIWVDTSKTPKVSNVAISGQWQKMTPTTPEEVNAYNKQEVEEKAKQALQDAKAFAENAENISKGVIDVGAIPLRTSITGARIEWDGVNGFVQYDRDGEPVNWFNLDGELYATRGHFSGDVSGATGTFGEVNVTTGDFNLKDENTGVKYSATPRRNLIRDHSFEMLPADGSSMNADSVKYNWLEVVPNKDLFELMTWERVGKPKVATTFAPDSLNATPIFGDQAAVVRNANYYRQYIYDGVAAGSTFTVSGHFKRQWNQSPGIPRVEIWHVLMDGSRDSKIVNSTFDRVKNNYSVDLRATTFTVPSSFVEGDQLEVIISGGDSNWVQCDGVQMGEGTRPGNYAHEDSLWMFLRGTYKPQYPMELLWSGTRYPTESQTVKPDKNLHECMNGWVVVWSSYSSGSAEDKRFTFTYIPKGFTNYNGSSISLALPTTAGNTAQKYIYVDHESITGHSTNNSGNASNIVMRAVFEW